MKKEIQLGPYNVNADYVKQFKTLADFKKDPGIFHLHTGAERDELFKQAWDAVNPVPEATETAKAVKNA